MLLTQQNSKLISEIEGNVFPGYYNNNPVLPDINQENLMKSEKSAFMPNKSQSLNKSTDSKVQNKRYGNVNNTKESEKKPQKVQTILNE